MFSEYVLFSARALTDIAGKHPDMKERIYERLYKIINAPDYSVEVTLKENAESLYDLKPTLVKYIQYAIG